VRHEHAARLLSEYLDGSLSAREASRLEAHLLGCISCRHALGGLRRTAELLRGLRGGVDAPDLADAVLGRIRAGEAEPSVLDRLRAGVSRFLSGPLGAPFATAAVGLALLAVLPRIEVEVSLPGRGGSEAAIADAAPRLAPRAERPRPMSSPLLARRVNESVSREPSRLALPSPMPFPCLEAASLEACRDQHAFLTELARENVWAFMAEVEEVPEPLREDFLAGISRFAAQSGAAPDVAAQLRATGDPRAQRMAIRFEEAR
jgi:Putative zinc-finger